jgi:hypothetical protein
MVNKIATFQSSETKKQLRLLNIFWMGFILYSLGYAISVTTIGISIPFCPIIQLVGLVLMLSIFGLVEFKTDNYYLSTIFVLYCIWVSAIILRGFSSFSDYTFIRGFFLDPRGGGILYFSPIILLFPRNLLFYKKLFQVIIILGLAYIIFNVLFIKEILNSDYESATSQTIVEIFSELAFASGFILLTFFIHSKKHQLTALLVITVAILIAMARARRGLLLMYSNMALVSYMIYILHSKKRYFVLYITIFLVIVSALYINGVYRPHNNHLFGYLLERGDEDTRSAVEIYFYDDMKTKDWIIGKGINGEYFAPDIEKEQLTNYRSNIETGYLQTILKGGLISLGLFILIAVPALLKGIFYSRNILSKAAGIWILMALINSYPSTVNTFTLRYLLVWISIGICYSKEIRQMENSYIKDIINPIQVLSK